MTPGTNLLAYCTGIGWRLQRSHGAVIAWLASSIPASLVALLATVLYERASASTVLALAVLLGSGIALLLLFASAWHLARPQLVASSLIRSLAIIALVIALVLLGVPPIAVLLAAAALGGAWSVTKP